jgi:hypothetical protein
MISSPGRRGVLDRFCGLLATDSDVIAVGQIASIYMGPHRLLLTAEIQPLDTISGIRLRHGASPTTNRHEVNRPAPSKAFAPREFPPNPLPGEKDEHSPDYRHRGRGRRAGRHPHDQLSSQRIPLAAPSELVSELGLSDAAARRQ